MKIAYVPALLAAAVLAACGGKPDHASADTKGEGAAPVPQKPGQVVFPANSPKLSQIRIEPVQIAEMPADEVSAPGKIEANSARLSHVMLPVTGRISSTTVKIGDFVPQGAPLLSIESPDVDLALSTQLQAEAGVTQARSGLLKAQADVDRARDLFEHNAIAKKEVLNAENVLAQSTAALEQALAATEQTRRKLAMLGVKPGEFGQKVVIRAPISGKVLEMNVVPGEYRNDLTQPVMTIADLSSVWVTSDVPESSIRLIGRGERIEVELAAYPDEKFHARVTRIADTVDPQTRTVKVTAALDNRGGRLRPEMFGRIRHVDSLKPLPVVPVGSVIQGDGKNIVFKETVPGTFEQTPVVLGYRAGDRVAIMAGLKAGDRVVTDGAMLLKTY